MQKKIPVRMCLGCRQKKAKTELLRVVKPADSENITIDKTGKKQGRGAYICKDANCFKKIRKSRALEREFECQIDENIFLSIEKEMTEIDAK